MGFSAPNYLGTKYEMKDGTTWRVISEKYGEHVHLIRMNVTKFENRVFGYEEFGIYVELGKFTVSEDQELRTIDTDNLSKEEAENYRYRKAFIDKFNDLYAPTYRNFLRRGKKEAFEALAKEIGIDKSTAYRIVRKYLQSGMQNSSLCKVRFKPKKAEYKVKTGRPARSAEGKLLTEDDVKNMDEAIELFKKNSLMSQEDAYRKMILDHYSKEVDGMIKAFSPGERPSPGQFYYHLRKVMSFAEIRKKITSDKEFRNNERLIDGTTLVEGAFPGLSVEVDTLEVRLEIIAEETADNSDIGKPILYLMVDRYTHCIVCFSIGFENNTVLGLSDLMLNMITPRHEIIAKYGISLDEGKNIDDIMPPPFIPQEIYSDRGSDYISKWFNGFCEENKIHLATEPGALGSYKGIVEGMFRKFERSFEAFLIDQGVIQYKHGSKHEKEACLTLTDVYHLVFAFVAKHNNQARMSFRLSPEMRKAKITPTPNNVWRFGVENICSPKLLPTSRYLESMFSLMVKKKAYISRKGVEYRDLFYTTDDPVMRIRMQRSMYLGNKCEPTGKRKNELDIRIDPRSINCVYYRDDDGKIKALDLNVPKSGFVKNMTWAKYEELLAEEKMEKKRYGESNLNTTLNYMHMVQSIAENAKTPCYANTDDKKAKRKDEREAINHGNNLTGKMKDLIEQQGGKSLPEPPSITAIPSMDEPHPEESETTETYKKDVPVPVSALPTECPSFFL